MANMEEKKDEHHEQFEYWLSIHAKSDNVQSFQPQNMTRSRDIY